jgi:hypothetical protein
MVEVEMTFWAAASAVWTPNLKGEGEGLYGP